MGQTAYLLLLLDTRPISIEKPGVAACRVGAGIFGEPHPTLPHYMHVEVLGKRSAPDYVTAKNEILASLLHPYLLWVCLLLDPARS